MIDNAKALQKYEPHRLYSLADMIQFIGHEVMGVLTAITNLTQKTKSIIEASGHDSSATPNQRQALSDLLEKRVAGICDKLNMVESAGRCWHLANMAIEDQKMPHLANYIVETELKGLAHSIMNELSNTQFAYISEDKTKFFEQDDLWGGPFHKLSSGDINAEIKAAGNCLAVDLHTAAVFHLMRTVEHGLRALAKHLDVAPSKWPTDYDGWENLISKIESELNKLESVTSNMTRGPEKDEQLDTLRVLLREIEYFKDKDRNPCCHTRKTYQKNEALGVFDHVRDFMLRLVKLVSLK